MTRRLIADAILLAVILAPAGARAAPAEIVRYRLDNGLSILLYPATVTDQVALVVLYAVGEDHDPADRCGISHLVEHLYVTAAAGETRARTVDEFMQRYPGASNAQTGSDYTVFATVFPRERLEEELRDAAARMADLRITQADLDREKPRLLRELGNMYGGIPQLASINHARALVRPLPFGHRKGGLPDHVRTASLDDVKGWWGKYYKPTSATLVMAGNFATETTRRLVAQYFASIAPGRAPPDAPRPGTGVRTETKVVEVRAAPRGVRPHVCLAFSTPDTEDEHYAAFLLLAARMMSRAQSRGGWPRVQFAPLDDPELISVSAAVGPDESPELTAARLRAFVDESLSAPLRSHDKRIAKNTLGFLLGFVDFPETMMLRNLYGVAFSLGRRAQLELDSVALGRKVDNLTEADVAAAGRAVFDSDRQAAVVVRPVP